MYFSRVLVKPIRSFYIQLFVTIILAVYFFMQHSDKKVAVEIYRNIVPIYFFILLQSLPHKWPEEPSSTVYPVLERKGIYALLSGTLVVILLGYRQLVQSIFPTAKNQQHVPQIYQKIGFTIITFCEYIRNH